MIMAAVKPAWAGMAKAVDELRPKFEPKLRENMGPIFKAEVDIMEKMRGKISFSFYCLSSTPRLSFPFYYSSLAISAVSS